MALDPDSLLVGPRARRLCLDAALVSQEGSGQPWEELRMAATLAAYDLDPGRGTSRVMYSVGGPAPAALPRVTPADVATLLSSLPVPRLGDLSS